MSKKGTISGLDILTYLRDSQVRVDDELCDVVPESATNALRCTKAGYVVDTLLNDKTGKLAHHFPDYYNRFPERTQPQQVQELVGAFRMFVEQIILGKEKGTSPSLNHKKATIPDILGKKIETLISETRAEWLHWSIKDGHKNILRNMKILLPLLSQKYENPILQSEAATMKENIDDVIPDEYINFLHDILMTLCTIYNTKVNVIQADTSLWAENAKLMNDIHSVANFLFYRLAWNAFDNILPENNNSVHYLARELITGLNAFYFLLQEETKMRAKMEEKPPEKE